MKVEWVWYSDIYIYWFEWWWIIRGGTPSIPSYLNLIKFFRCFVKGRLKNFSWDWGGREWVCLVLYLNFYFFCIIWCDFRWAKLIIDRRCLSVNRLWLLGWFIRLNYRNILLLIFRIFQNLFCFPILFRWECFRSLL